jgi:hypothetical protein
LIITAKVAFISFSAFWAEIINCQTPKAETAKLIRFLRNENQTSTSLSLTGWLLKVDIAGIIIKISKLQP